MRRACLLQLLVAALLLSAARADDSTDCAMRVREARTQLEDALREAHGNALACKKNLQEEQAKYSSLYDTWQRKASEADSLQATIKQLQAQLKTAAKQGAKVDDWASLLALVAAHTKHSCVAAAEEAKLIFQELQHGKTSRLVDLLGSWVSAFRGATSCSVKFVSELADKYLPDSVKAQIKAVAAKVQEEWKEHVTDAAWAQPVLKQLASVVAEVQAVVAKALSSHPALAPLADPVTVQLVVYAVFALPLLLVLVLPLALFLGRRSPGASTAKVVRPPGKGKARKTAGKHS